MEKTIKHPKGLYVLSSTEMWERFNFYGMRAILALFISESLNFSIADTSKIVGAFLGLSYLSCMLGGYLADNILGNKKCLYIGGVIMSLGQMFLFICASIFSNNLALATNFLWLGLGLITIGVGLFKPNISGMVGMLYTEKDKKLDSAYTIFYMGINLGAFIGMTICSFLADVKNNEGIRDLSSFKWGFLASSIAILIGVFVYMIFSKKYVVTPNNKAIGIEPNKIKNTTETKINFFQKKTNLYILLLCVFTISIFYFLLKKQEGIDYSALIYSFIYGIGISLVINIFIDKTITPQERSRISVIIICSFFVIFFWAAFEQASISLTYIADKQTDTRIFKWNLPPSLVQNANSVFVILLSPFFGWLWLYLQRKSLEPIAYTKQALGILLLALGYFIIACKVKDLDVNGKINVVWLFLLYFFHSAGELCLSPIGLAIVYKLAPKKLISLLMSVWFLANAAGYALSGTLGALLPPTPDKYIKAKTLGIDLGNILNGSQQLTLETQKILTANKIPFEYPKILGVQIQNLFQFFMCFVFMCFVSSILLFIISKKLKKMEA